MQKRLDEERERQAEERKLRELAKTPMAMVLTRIAQLLGAFADVAAKLESVNRLAQTATLRAGASPASERSITRVLTSVRGVPPLPLTSLLLGPVRSSARRAASAAVHCAQDVRRVAGREEEGGEASGQKGRLLANMSRGTLGRRELDAFVRKAQSAVQRESPAAQEELVASLRAKEAASVAELTVRALDLLSQVTVGASCAVSEPLSRTTPLSDTLRLARSGECARAACR